MYEARFLECIYYLYMIQIIQRPEVCSDANGIIKITLSHSTRVEDSYNCI